MVDDDPVAVEVEVDGDSSLSSSEEADTWPCRGGITVPENGVQSAVSAVHGVSGRLTPSIDGVVASVGASLVGSGMLLTESWETGMDGVARENSGARSGGTVKYCARTHGVTALHGLWACP
jgi:hypothetical protein